MAVLTYNGIALPFQKNEGVEQSIPSDDGADQLYVKKTYSVTSTLTSTIPGLMLPGETWAQTVNRINHQLSMWRQNLTVDFGGGQIVNSGPLVDLKNGPIPDEVKFTNFVGLDCVTVHFTVTTWVNPCNNISANQSQVITNRWEESVNIDGATFLTTRTRRGKLVIRPGNLGPDSFRGMVTPPIPENFVRQSSDYVVASDGLSLSYTFIDAEKVNMPPSGVIDAKGTFTLSGEKSIWKYAEVTISLTGDRNQSKTALVQLAAAVAMERLNRQLILGQNGQRRWNVTSGMIREEMYENRITVAIRTIVAPPRIPKKFTAGGFWSGFFGGFGSIGAGKILDNANKKPGDDPRATDTPIIPQGITAGKVAEGFGSPPLGSNPAVSPDPGLRSTGGLLLAAAALNDPCLSVYFNPGTDPANDPNTAYAPSTDLSRGSEGKAARSSFIGGAAVTVSVGDPAADTDPNEVMTGIYTDYQLMLEVEEDMQLNGVAEQRSDGFEHFIQVATPTLRLRVRWSAERIGEPPAPPPKDLGDANAVYLRGRWNPGNVEVAEDGVSLICQSQGEYLYGFRDRSAALVSAGMPAWVADLIGVGPAPVVYNGPPGIGIAGIVGPSSTGSTLVGG